MADLDTVARLRELLAAASGPSPDDDCMCAQCVATRNVLRAAPKLLDEVDAARAMLDQLDEAEVLVDAVNNHPNGDDINKAIESYEAAQGATDAALARLEDGAGRVTEEEDSKQ